MGGNAYLYAQRWPGVNIPILQVSIAYSSEGGLQGTCSQATGQETLQSSFPGADRAGIDDNFRLS